MEVAFLGLGAMGRPMARNLAKAGHRVRAWNRTPRAFPELEAAGVAMMPSVAEAVAGAEVVMSCVLDDEAVRALAAEVFAHGRPGLIYIDHSTIQVATAQELAEQALARGMRFVDAPISGGAAGAEAATLTVMVGTDADTFERIKPLLSCIGERIHHLGPSGSGQSMKLINQLLTALHQAAAVEALHLAQQAGLDLEQVGDVLSTSYGQSRMLERTVPVVIRDDYASPFTINLLAKDVNLIAGWAQRLQIELPLLQQAQAIFQGAQAAGLGDQDGAALILRLRGQA